jgi:hypothetical protein
LPLVAVADLAPGGLELAENNDVEPLVDVGAMSGVPNHLDGMLSRVLKEGTAVMGGMAINKMKSTAPAGFRAGVRIPIPQPINADLAVDVTLLRISKPILVSECESIFRDTHGALRGLSCFQLAWNASSL